MGHKREFSYDVKRVSSFGGTDRGGNSSDESGLIATFSVQPPFSDDQPLSSPVLGQSVPNPRLFTAGSIDRVYSTAHESVVVASLEGPLAARRPDEVIEVIASRIGQVLNNPSQRSAMIHDNPFVLGD